MQQQQQQLYVASENSPSGEAALLPKAEVTQSELPSSPGGTHTWFGKSILGHPLDFHVSTLSICLHPQKRWWREGCGWSLSVAAPLVPRAGGGKEAL